MSSKKVLFLILHGKIYSHRHKYLVNTWLKDQDYLFYGDYEDIEKNIIKVSDDSSYHSNEAKFVNVITSLEDKYMNYEWYFFADDDTFVNTFRLYDSLFSFEQGIIGREINYYPADKSLFYYSGGAGILVYSSIMKHLRYNFKNYKTGFSDVSLGYYMKEYGISTSGKYNSLFHPYKAELTDVDIPASIGFHYITEEADMVRYHEACKNKYLNFRYPPYRFCY